MRKTQKDQTVHYSVTYTCLAIKMSNPTTTSVNTTAPAPSNASNVQTHYQPQNNIAIKTEPAPLPPPQPAPITYAPVAPPATTATSAIAPTTQYQLQPPVYAAPTTTLTSTIATTAQAPIGNGAILHAPPVAAAPVTLNTNVLPMMSASAFPPQDHKEEFEEVREQVCHLPLN